MADGRYGGDGGGGGGGDNECNGRGGGGGGGGGGDGDMQQHHVYNRPQQPPSPDPRLNLTAMQVFKLKKNWKGIKRRLEDTGVEMLIRLFRVAPATQAQYRHLETEEKLRMSEELEKHAGRMMSTLDDIVNNIEDVDYALGQISKMAEDHFNLEGFTTDQFVLMEQPFLDAVRIILDDRYTDNMDVIYRILIKFILQHLTESTS